MKGRFSHFLTFATADELIQRFRSQRFASQPPGCQALASPTSRPQTLGILRFTPNGIGSAIGWTLLAMVVAGCAPQPSFDSTRNDHVLSVDPPAVADTDHLAGTDHFSGPSHWPAQGTPSRVEARLVQFRGDLESIPAGKAEKDTRLIDGIELIPTPEGVPEAESAAAAKGRAAAASGIGAPEPSKITPENEKSQPATKIPVTGVDDGPEDYQTWPAPTAALVFTGNQHGYIEPCGCTGLDRQKGGVARRYSFLESLREKPWPVVPMDVGNQVRRVGKQAAIKLQQSVRALEEMKYRAVGFGPEDVRMPVGELLSVAAMEETPDDTMFVSANVVLFDPSLMPQSRVIEQNGIQIGVTSVLDPKSIEIAASDDLSVNEIVPATRAAIQTLQEQATQFNVILFYGEEDRAKHLVTEVPGCDLIVVAGGYGEPTYQPTKIDGSPTQMITTGVKGMYAGIVGLYQNNGDPSSRPQMRYARVALTHQFADAAAMRGLMKDYQDQLRDIGLSGLGLEPIPHPTQQKFVGSATCGKCHTEAMDVWEGSAHAHATDSIVMPPRERGDVARHFDPECISCHVTGWNPQDYYPYQSGYLSLDSTAHLKGNGCENCHGPGAEHAAAEEKGSTIEAAVRQQLRLGMRLTLEKAREKCITCHDLDNSPDFHQPDAFEDVYWPEVEHYGVE